jgi:glycosyltransferase involved in cell wall biosynthesis
MNILMLPVPSGKPWNGATMHQEALGGSESAVAYLARSFVRRGHVVVVATHGTPGVFDGVSYHNQVGIPNLLLADWDVLISSRWLEILNEPWKSTTRFFWTHDLPHVDNIQIPVDRVVFLSRFHRATWGISDEWAAFIGNGVDTSLFYGPQIPRNENVLVWTSNPDRGLALACRIFQEIRKRWPDLELHVYGRAAVYGWDASQEAPFMPLPEHQEHVFIHEPLNKAGLAKVLREAWAWYYPTYWPETYCIAALEAQAAGTPVISVPYGALPETVHGGVLSWDILNAVSQLRNKSKWEKESQAGLEFAATRDWDHVADEWLALIELVKAGKAVADVPKQ